MLNVCSGKSYAGKHLSSGIMQRADICSSNVQSNATFAVTTCKTSVPYGGLNLTCSVRVEITHAPEFIYEKIMIRCEDMPAVE